MFNNSQYNFDNFWGRFLIFLLGSILCNPKCKHLILGKYSSFSIGFFFFFQPKFQFVNLLFSNIEHKVRFQIVHKSCWFILYNKTFHQSNKIELICLPDNLNTTCANYQMNVPIETKLITFKTVFFWRVLVWLSIVWLINWTKNETFFETKKSFSFSLICVKC